MQNEHGPDSGEIERMLEQGEKAHAEEEVTATQRKIRAHIEEMRDMISNGDPLPNELEILLTLDRLMELMPIPNDSVGDKKSSYSESKG